MTHIWQYRAIRPFPTFPSEQFAKCIRVHGVLLRLAAKYSEAMCGVCPGTLVTCPLLHLSMIYCCALSPWSQICVTCQSCWFLGSVALSCCAGTSCLVSVGWRHMYEMDMEHFANQHLSVVVVKYWLLGFVVYDRTFMCIVFTAIVTKMITYMTVY